MKIKGTEYLRLHKIMTEVSTKTVWEVLSSGGKMDSVLQDVPDEFYSKIKEYELELVGKFNELKEEYKLRFSSMNTEDRKEFAFSAKETKYPAVLFKMLNGQSPDNILWKVIKPEFRKL
jgi:RNA ligase